MLRQPKEHVGKWIQLIDARFEMLHEHWVRKDGPGGRQDQVMFPLWGSDATRATTCRDCQYTPNISIMYRTVAEATLRPRLRDTEPKFENLYHPRLHLCFPTLREVSLHSGWPISIPRSLQYTSQSACGAFFQLLRERGDTDARIRGRQGSPGWSDRNKRKAPPGIVVSRGERDVRLGVLDLDTFRDACYFDAFRVWQERVDATTTCACCKRMLGVSCLARLMGNRYALRAKHDSFKQPDLPTTTTYLNWLDAQDPHRLVRLHADDVDGLALTTVTCSLSDAVDKELKGGCDGKWKVLYGEFGYMDLASGQSMY